MLEMAARSHGDSQDGGGNLTASRAALAFRVGASGVLCASAVQVPGTGLSRGRMHSSITSRQHFSIFWYHESRSGESRSETTWRRPVRFVPTMIRTGMEPCVLA